MYTHVFVYPSSPWGVGLRDKVDPEIAISVRFIGIVYDRCYCSQCVWSDI